MSLCVLSVLHVLPALVHAEPVAPYQQVGPSTWHASQQVTSGPLNFNILRVHLPDPRTTLEAEAGQNVMYKGETVGDSSRREAEPGKTNIVAGVNGDFWAMSPKPYTPVGPLVSDGWIHSLGSRKRSVFAITRDEKVYIGPVDFTISVVAGKQTIPVTDVNLPKISSVVLFTPPFGAELPESTATRYLLKLNKPELLPNELAKAKLSKIETTAALALPEGHAVLSVPQKSKWVSVLDKAKEVTLNARMPQVGGVVASCVGGAPRLLLDGKVDVNDEQEGLSKSFVTGRHPRTAAGVTKDGHTVFLVTVDGRQPQVSIGQNLYELAEYMQALGCSEAINLDGGGSTTMVVGGKVVNRPSDLKGPRPVTNSLLVVATVDGETTGSNHSARPD